MIIKHFEEQKLDFLHDYSFYFITVCRVKGFICFPVINVTIHPSDEL